MKKLICLLAGLGLLAGCAGSPVSSSSPPAPTPTAQTAAPSPEPAGPTATPTLAELPGLAAVLDSMTEYGPGEAGGSLKTAASSAALADWCEENAAEAGQPAMEQALKAWLDGVGADKAERFWLNWPGVDAQARAIIADPAAQKELLESAGTALGHTCYTLERYELFADVVTAIQ